MQVAELDASHWTSVLDVYDAIYDALGSQYSARNINALMEGLYWDHAYDMLNGTSHCGDYKLKPPFALRIVNADKALKPAADELALIQMTLAEAHDWFRNKWERGDVIVELEIV